MRGEERRVKDERRGGREMRGERDERRERGEERVRGTEFHLPNLELFSVTIQACSQTIT